MSKLPSKYKFTVQEPNEAPSCPPKKPTAKAKAAKKEEPKGDD